MPTVSNTKEKETQAKLYYYDSLQSLTEAEKSLKARRVKQDEIEVTFKPLPISTQEMAQTDIATIKSMVLPKEQKEKMITAIEKFYKSYPTNSVYFESQGNSGYITHMVVRKDDKDPGIRYPLSDLAKETTLFKFFNINQRTMELVDSDTQADFVNLMFNQNKDKSIFNGVKKVRLNHRGEVRSIHSKQYKFIDHLEVIDKVKDFIQVDEADRFEIMLDEKFMLMYFLLKNHIQKKYKNDVVEGGICIYNSEVGLGSLQVYTFLEVNHNTRFLIKPTKNVYDFREVHKGYDADASLENFANHLDFATNYIIEIMNKYKTLYRIKLDNPKKTMEAVCLRFQKTSSKKIRKHLVEQVEAVKNPTFRDIVHLIAELNLNQKHNNIGFRHEMQKIAGTLINYTEEEIVEIM